MKRIIFRKNVLLELGHVPNAHQLALRSGVSVPTVAKYINKPEKSETITGEVLASILLNGLQLTEKQVLDLRIGDLFEFFDPDKQKADPLT